MKLLGLDIETGDFNAESTFITEIAAVLWDTDRKQPLEFFSSFINEGRSITKEAEEYTGIDNIMIQTYGKSLEDVSLRLLDLSQQADFLVSHNALKFDKPIVERKFPCLRGKEWIDTLVDVAYPNNCKAKNLTYLQAFHGFVSPFPHRALFDVCTMFKILDQYDIDKVVESALSPEVCVIARFNYPHRTHPNYTSLMINFNETKDKVKQAGFNWNPEEKLWKYTTKQINLDKLKFDFPVYIEEQKEF